MPENDSIINKPAFSVLFILVLPFVVFWWLLPGSSVIIGNDYPDYSIRSQMEYFYSITNGTFPLFIPGFWYGQTAAAFPLAQIYHPVSWLTYILPGYWEGEALHLYTVTKLFSIGTAHLALFYFFRRMGLVRFLSFICSFAVIYNLRMLDLLRYGSSLEAYTGFILLTVSLEYLYRDTDNILRKIYVIGSTYLVVVSGHPQMSYYALMGAAIFLVTIPLLFKESLVDRSGSLPPAFSFILNGGILIAVGIVLSSVFTLPFYFEYMLNNASRVEMPYNWSLLYSTTPVSLLNNFTVPYRAEIHSAFGASALFLFGGLSVFFAKRLLADMKVLTLLLISIVVMLIMLGKGGYINNYLWEYLPFYSSFRTPGRISIILPFFLVLIYSLYLKDVKNVNNKNYILGTHVVISVIYFSLSLLTIFYLPLPEHYTPQGNIDGGGKHLQIEFWFALFNSLLIVFLGLYIVLSKKLIKHTFALLSAILLVVLTGALLYKGTWVIPYSEAEKYILTIDEFDDRTQGLGEFGYGFESKNVREQLDNYKFDSDSAIIFPEIRYTDSRSETYQFLKENGQSNTVVIEDHDHHGKSDVLCESGCDYAIKLTCQTYNKLEYSIKNNSPGILKVNIPYSENWVALLNENVTEISRANGFEMAILLPEKGKHELKLIYRSWAFITGLSITLLTLAIILVVGVNRTRLNKFGRLAVSVAIVASVFGVIMSADKWLFEGDCLPRSYSWSNHDATGSM